MPPRGPGSLGGLVAMTKVVDLAAHTSDLTSKEDVSDWLAAGHAMDELRTT